MEKNTMKKDICFGCFNFLGRKDSSHLVPCPLCGNLVEETPYLSKAWDIIHEDTAKEIFKRWKRKKL